MTDVLYSAQFDRENPGRSPNRDRCPPSPSQRPQTLRSQPSQTSTLGPTFLIVINQDSLRKSSPFVSSVQRSKNSNSRRRRASGQSYHRNRKRWDLCLQAPNNSWCLPFFPHDLAKSKNSNPPLAPEPRRFRLSDNSLQVSRPSAVTSSYSTFKIQDGSSGTPRVTRMQNWPLSLDSRAKVKKSTSGCDFPRGTERIWAKPG
jgi:hypothetical protein